MKKKRLSLSNSLAGILILLMASLAVVPIALMGFIGTKVTSNELTITKQDELLNTVEVQKSVIEDWLSTRQNEMEFLANEVSSIGLNPDEFEKPVYNFAEKFPYYEAVLVANKYGGPILSTDGIKANISDRDYFQSALEGKPAISDALISRGTGNIIIVFAVPIYDAQNNVIAVVVGTAPTNNIEGIIESARPGESGDIYLVNQNQLYISPSRFEEEALKLGLIENRSEKELSATHIAAQEALLGNSGIQEYENALGKEVIGAYTAIPQTGWAIIAEQETDEAYQGAYKISFLTFIVAIVTAFVVIGLAGYFSTRLTIPINHLSQTAEQLSLGEIHISNEDNTFLQKISKRKDEIGHTAVAILEMIAYFKSMTDVATHIADGDLNDIVEPKSDNDIFGNAFSGMITSLRVLINEVKHNSEQVTEASAELKSVSEQTGMATNQVAATIQQVATGTSDQAAAAGKAAAGVQDVSFAIERVSQGVNEQTQAVEKASQITGEISEIIQQVSDSIKQATVGAKNAAELSRNGSTTVDETIMGMSSIQMKVNASAEKIQEMGRRSHEIGAIVETIEDIAGQTNLLALNAAIEAARAGEHGKGFAVVADEVRKLAERSSTSTKEINELITGIQQTVADAVLAMDEGSNEVNTGMQKAGQAGNALTEILTSVEGVYNDIARVENAAEQMMESSKTLVNSVDMVSNVIDNNRQAVEEMNHLSNTMSSSIESIASVAEENSASVEEVSASTEELNAQAEEVAASANAMMEMAVLLKEHVARFSIDNE
jgi:methyl-accepting chemotaxis protein